MDYHHDRERNSKHYASSPTAYAANGASPRPGSGYHQERESRSSNRSSRSHQGSEGGESRRHRSSRGSSRLSPLSAKPSPHQHHNRSSSHGYASSPHNPGGTTNVPQDAGYMVPSHYDGNGSTHGSQHSSAMPMTSQYENGVAAVTPNPASELQTNIPPHVSSSYSQGSTQSKRPAYLLHRDLVIGKGSYGQVCIASRGEAEGHNSGNGKRKKFACKCVVLRNDAKYIAKLQEEVNVLRELRGHENVIRLFDVFCVDNELFIITELGRGGDLFHLLTTHPKHGVTEAYAGM